MGGDIRILFAHLPVMGIMKRGNAAKYWSNCDITLGNIYPEIHTRCFYPIFIVHLTLITPIRNTGQGGFYLLMKVVAVSEGKSIFLTYNKDKPNKWAIKLFEVAD